ncbi:MAG: PilN domain-containing protein [Caulobacteraceae bacterium]
MTLQELLNADMHSIGGFIRQGFAWWLDELAAMAPASWRGRLSARPKLVAEPVAGGAWRCWRDGRPVPVDAARRAAGVGLVLPPGMALTREVQFPRLPLADVRRMVAMDLDRLSPLRPDLVFFDVEVIDRDAAGGRQTVLVGVLPREAAARQLAAARDDGLSPKALGVAIAEGAPEAAPVSRFDFMPAVRRAAGETPGGGPTRYWWDTTADLLVIKPGVLVGRDMLSVAKLREAVAAQRDAVDAVNAVRRRVDGENNERRDLVARGARNEPLRMLAALTTAVPAGAWVQRLEWNGQTLRVIGAKSPEVDMFAALRGSPAFTNPRAAAAEAPARPGPGQGQPFDITADAGKRLRP